MTRDRRVHLVGALVAIPFGCLGPIVLLQERWPSLLNQAQAIAMIILAPIVGWLFATTAARPGLRHAIGAAAGLAFTAVFLGSFATSAIASVLAAQDVATILATTIGGGLLGLVFVGVPMFLMTLALALIWVGAVRVGLHMVRLTVGATAAGLLILIVTFAPPAVT